MRQSLALTLLGILLLLASVAHARTVTTCADLDGDGVAETCVTVEVPDNPPPSNGPPVDDGTPIPPMDESKISNITVAQNNPIPVPMPPCDPCIPKPIPAPPSEPLPPSDPPPPLPPQESNNFPTFDWEKGVQVAQSGHICVGYYWSNGDQMICEQGYRYLCWRSTDDGVCYETLGDANQDNTCVARVRCN